MGGDCHGHGLKRKASLHVTWSRLPRKCVTKGSLKRFQPSGIHGDGKRRAMSSKRPKHYTIGNAHTSDHAFPSNTACSSADQVVALQNMQRTLSQIIKCQERLEEKIGEFAQSGTCPCELDTAL